VNRTYQIGIDPPRFHDQADATCAPVTVATTTDEATPRGATINPCAALATRFTQPGSPIPAGISTKGLPNGAHNVVNSGDHRRELGSVEMGRRHELLLVFRDHRTFGRHSRYRQRSRPLIIDQIAACPR
jgi:hypothetical protein